MTDNGDDWSVGDLAGLAGVTVRTLRHYDRIGLLHPRARSAAGHRRYGPAELARLREVLVWRRLGIPLDRIGGMISGSRSDRLTVLQRQRRAVAAEHAELSTLLRVLDAAISAHEGEEGMTHDARIIASMDGFDPAGKADEARHRWGGTTQHITASRPTATYGDAEWRAIRAEALDIWSSLVRLWEHGAPPHDERATAEAGRFHAHLQRWFYDCDAGMLRHLGRMYRDDPGFRAFYDGEDGSRTGHADWVAEVWAGYADRTDDPASA